jgi:ammonium transporter Rh
LTDAAKTVDTCGVLYLHGLPGIFGGIAALFVVSGINIGAQLSGILVTVVIAACSGLVSGKMIAVLGRKMVPYDDSEEFEGEEIDEEDMELQPVIASEDGVA